MYARVRVRVRVGVGVGVRVVVVVGVRVGVGVRVRVRGADGGLKIVCCINNFQEYGITLPTIYTISLNCLHPRVCSNDILHPGPICYF